MFFLEIFVFYCSPVLCVGPRSSLHQKTESFALAYTVNSIFDNISLFS